MVHATRWCLLLILVTSAADAADGAPEVFTDDFKDGSYSPDWVIQDGAVVTVESMAGHGVLKIDATAESAPSLHTTSTPGRWENFVFDAEMRGTGGWVGVRFRKGYDLLFDDKNKVRLRKDYQVLQTADVPGTVEQFKHVRLICAGDSIVVMVNDRRLFVVQSPSPGPMPVGLLSHKSAAEYAKLSLTSNLPVDAAIRLKVTHPDGALVYDPGKPISLDLALHNASPKRLKGKLEARLTPAGRWAEAKGVSQVAGLRTDELLRARETEAGVQLSIDGDDPFALTRVGHRLILQAQTWDTLYTRARIKRNGDGGVGFVFSVSPAGRFELTFDPKGRLALRHVSGDWKTITVMGASVNAFPADSSQLLEVTVAGGKIHASVDGTEALAATWDGSTTGAAGLFFLRGAGTFDEWVMAPSKAEADRGWRPKMIEQPAAASMATVDLDLEPGDSNVKVGLKPVAEGYYILSLNADGTDLGATYPFCSWTIDPAWATPRAAERFPLIVYSKYAWEDAGSDEIATNTYFHAMCRTLRVHGLNGAIHEFKTSQQFSIAARYGIEPVLRANMTELFNQPGVQTIFVGDEPKVENVEAYKAEYEQVRKQLPAATLVTCMVGEATGSGKDHDPVKTWDLLQADVRLFRHYPIRGVDWDILNPKPGMAPFLEAFRRANELSTPWQFVLQTFGSEPSAMRPSPHWRDPNGDELLAMAHVALAHGAKGLYMYTLQAENEWEALTWPRSLAACDDKLAAIDELTAFVGATQEILLAGKQSGPAVAPASPQVLAKAIEANGAQYVYVVNMNVREPQETRVSIDRALKSATDVVSKQTAKLNAGADGKAAIDVTLKPGRGVLMRLE